jgi:hypothetical protein
LSGVLVTLFLRALKQLDHSAREASDETKGTKIFYHLYILTAKQQVNVVRERVEVVGLFGMGPKTGAQKSIHASLFPFFWAAATIPGGRQNRALVTSLAQARLRPSSGLLIHSSC